ncbi:MAG: ArsR/SmtB family transcription factor [Acidimicrobiia bacterium]
MAGGPLGHRCAGPSPAALRPTGDPSRILILHLLATSGRPMSVGEITAALDIGQSTVSHHLKKLSEVGFVLVEHVGTASLYRVNDRCLECFPSAAQLVMDRVPAEFVAAVERAS